MCKRENWPACVIKQVETYERQIANVVGMVPDALVAEQLKKRFSFVERVSASYYIFIYCKVNAFDDVAPLLLVLREMGYAPSRMDKQSPEYGIPRRTYTFYDTEKTKVVFEVVAEMPNDTDGTCRRIKTGVKTRVVEEAIYEIECDNTDIDKYAMTEDTDID